MADSEVEVAAGGGSDADGLQVHLAQHDGSIRAHQKAIDAFALRLDSLEAKQQEFARLQEESVKTRLEIFEQRLEQSLAKRGDDDARRQKERLQQLEQRVEEQLGEGLFDRLHALETQGDTHFERIQKLNSQVAENGAGGQGGQSGSAVAVDRRVKELATKVDRAMKEALEVHATMKEHEVHMSALQKRVDGPGGLLERTSRAEAVDVEGLLERTRQTVRDESTLRASEFDIVRKRMDDLDAHQRDLAADILEAVRGEYDKLMLGLADVGGGDDGAAANGASTPPPASPARASPSSLEEHTQASLAPSADFDSLPRGRAVGYHAAIRREAARAAETAVRRLRRDLAESLHDCKHVPELRRQVSQLLGGRVRVGVGEKEGGRDERGRFLSESPRASENSDLCAVKARLAECERVAKVTSSELSGVQEELNRTSRGRTVSAPLKEFGARDPPQRFDSGNVAPKFSPSPSSPTTARDEAPAMQHMGSDGGRLTASSRRRESMQVLSGQQRADAEGDVVRLMSGLSVASDASSGPHMRAPFRHLRMGSQDSAQMEPEDFKREMMGLCESTIFCHSETETESEDESDVGFGGASEDSA